MPSALPIADPAPADGLLPGTTEQATVQALLCVLVIDHEAETPVQGCSTDTSLVDGTHFMITLLARGQGDCDGTECRAEAMIRELTTQQIWEQPIVTEVVPLTRFYPAEDYHREYYDRNPEQGYCQVVISPKVAKLRQKFAAKLKS